MARAKPTPSKEFVEYQLFIVEHKNYADLPDKRNLSGEITWVTPSNKSRDAWWDRKAGELGVKNRAEAARLIHPLELGGLKPCSLCGTKKSIQYVYPKKSLLKYLNSLSTSKTFSAYEETIDEILDYLANNEASTILKQIASKLNLELGQSNLKELRNKFHEEKTQLSPGVMSNAGDRLDGFHTYNACCRHIADKGRHKTNLVRYSQDRRAYENWAEGDWRGANRLMGEFSRQLKASTCPSCKEISNLTADHLGPISLGFCHRIAFRPLCKSCNSSRNNRLTKQDIEYLLKEEESGIQVISWHSKFIWDSLKSDVKTEADAARLSDKMRENLHNVLLLLKMIKDLGATNVLISYLNPEYAHYDFEFEEIDPKTGKVKFTKKKIQSKNTNKNADRYIRISLESLSQYHKKKNRNHRNMMGNETSLVAKEIAKRSNLGQIESARKLLEEEIRRVGELLLKSRL